MVDSQSIAKSNDGLSKGSVGLVGLIFQAMGQLSPIGIFGGSILGAMSFALGATPLSFVIGLFASLLAGNSVYQYSRKVASARGYYGYVGHGLGGIAGGYVSYMYILYQLANLVFIIAYYVLTFGITVGFVFNTSIPNYYGYIYAILISAPAFYVVYRGIKPSYRSQIVSNSIQLIFVVLISVVVILSVKDNTTMVFTPMAGIGWKGVLLGFIAGSYLSFAGYGSVVPLGEEAKTPHRSIGLAVLIIILVMGGIYLLGSYSIIVGLGYTQIGAFNSSPNNIFPGFVVVGHYAGQWANYVFLILNFFVVYPLFVTMGTALSRNIYAMSRDGLMKNTFQTVHSKYKSPDKAVKLTVGLFAILAVVSGFIFLYSAGDFIGGFFNDFLFFAIMSTVTTLIIHVLVNVSLARDYFRAEKGVLRILTDVVLPLLSTAIVFVAIYYAINGLGAPLSYSPLIVLFYSVIVVVYLVSARKKFVKINYRS